MARTSKTMLNKSSESKHPCLLDLRRFCFQLFNTGLSMGLSYVSFIVVQLFRSVRLFVIPWTAACQDSLTFTISQSLLKLMSLESVMPCNHLILCCPFSFCLQSFPASGSFPVSQLFVSRGQNIGASALASVFPVNIQG